MVTIKIMRYSDAVIVGPYIWTTKMDRLRLSAPLLPNDVTQKLLNLNATPHKVPISGFVCDLKDI